MKKFFEKLIKPTEEYIVAIALIMVATVLNMITIYNNYHQFKTPELIYKIMMLLVTAAIFSVLIKALQKRFDLDYWYQILVVPIMIIIYFYVGDLGITFGVKLVMINGALALMFLMAPFIQRDVDSDYYTYKVFIALALTMLAYFILTGGIILTIWSTSLLFEFTIPAILNRQIMIGILGFVMPTVFLALIPHNEQERDNYPNFILKVVSFAFVPILTVYTAVVYAYLLKILITFKLPSNVLGNLVIFYAIVSIIILYFSHKLDYGYKVVNRFMTWYGYFLILPVTVMAYSFIVRIANYGITEPRYYALLVFFLVTGSIFIIKKFNAVKYTLVLLAALLLISIAPGVSAYRLSSMSQEQRFRNLLEDYRMLSDNKVTPRYDLSSEQQSEIITYLNYFLWQKDINELDFLPKDFKMEYTYSVFGFDQYGRDPNYLPLPME